MVMIVGNIKDVKITATFAYPSAGGQPRLEGQGGRLVGFRATNGRIVRHSSGASAIDRRPAGGWADKVIR